ncbi:MAG: CCA tRNA nucleotidyltransferase [Nitrosopumilus sp. H8]|nr:MAG: CCA tRNA nucleotidyltransferase [Nitrosopumilus sp. H13]RNJ79739.1 MAG: CCA tRNA nucleotidyltransferase [Nitrosopumilus sp. H8]
MRRIISAVARDVTPSKAAQDMGRKTADEMLDMVRKVTAGLPQVTDVQLGGSLAKGTWLSEDADVDIFVGFKRSVSKERFEETARQIGFESLNGYSPYVKYSEHPYVEARVRKTRVNVVPYYDVKQGEWKSSADRSPYHTRLMKKSLTTKMRGEVRVLKAFLKANGIYGAEIARQGFSGYVAEVLVLNFKSFEGVVRNMAGIGRNTTIGRAEKKFDGMIIITDPVDGKRNLAAAISERNLGRFVLLCRAFAARPSADFFKKRRPRVSKRLWDDMLVVSFGFRERSPDIIWGQAKRIAFSLSRQLELGGFVVLRSKAHVGEKAHLFFLLESGCIPLLYQKDGPEFFRQGSSEKFIGKNRRDLKLVWIKDDGRITSLRERRHPDAVGFMKWFLKNNIQSDIPSGLQDDFVRGFKVSMGSGGLGKSIKEAADELISTDGAFLHFD